MKKTLLSAVFATAFLTAAAAQSAIVTQWKVGVSAEFNPNSVVWDESNGTAGARNVSSSSLSWGTSTGSGISGLDIGSSPATTYVNTNLGPVNNITVTHTNYPITGVTLDSVDLLTTLTLTPWAPPGASSPALTLTFKIDFKETPNAATPCADGGTNGVGINLSGCADIFVIDQSSLNFPFWYDIVTNQFGANAGSGFQQYFISFFEANNRLKPLSDAACSAAGVADNCLGFLTAENTQTTAQFAAVITTTPVSVPEPGTLGLLGIALTGLALARRRKI